MPPFHAPAVTGEILQDLWVGHGVAVRLLRLSRSLVEDRRPTILGRPGDELVVAVLGWRPPAGSEQWCQEKTGQKRTTGIHGDILSPFAIGPGPTGE